MAVARTMSMDMSTSRFKGDRRKIREEDFFSDDDENSMIPRGSFNPESDVQRALSSYKEDANANGSILSTRNLDKLDDVHNVFYVQHQRFVRFHVDIKKGLTLVNIPKSFLQNFRKSINGSYFRVAILGFMFKPLYTQISTSIKAGIVDFRGVSDGGPSEREEGILTTRNVSDTDALQKAKRGFEWLNYVTIPTDQMSFSAVNTANYFSVSDWDDCKIAFEIPTTITRKGKTALVIDISLSLDETDNPNLYELAVIPPHFIPPREVQMLRSLKSMLKLIQNNADKVMLLQQKQSLVGDEGSRGEHKGAKLCSSDPELLIKKTLPPL